MTTGHRLFCKEFPCFNIMPCRHMHLFCALLAFASRGRAGSRPLRFTQVAVGVSKIPRRRQDRLRRQAREIQEAESPRSQSVSIYLPICLPGLPSRLSIFPSSHPPSCLPARRLDGALRLEFRKLMSAFPTSNKAV